MPSAPAPTEVSDTSTPRIAPSSTVSATGSRPSVSPSRGVRAATMRWRSSVATADTTSTTPSSVASRCCVADECSLAWPSSSSVTIVVGTLPNASRRTMLQSSVPRQPWTVVPTVLVAAA